jgi:hypothetical protein
MPSRFSSRSGLAILPRSALLALALGLPGAFAAACGNDGTTTEPGTSAAATSAATSTGTSSTSAGTGGAGGSGGEAAATSGATASTGAGGEGGAPPSWPDCTSQPAGSAATTLKTIWQDDPAAPTPVWLQGVYVTALSKNGCVSGEACDIFVQEQESFADLAAAAQRSLKLFVSPATSEHFLGLAVGDKLDVYAHAWRYDVSGEDELLLQVNLQLPGCALKVGSGSPQPVAAKLSELTQQAYYTTHGPVLVQVSPPSGLSGTPHLPEETFAIYETGVFSDAGVEELMSLSPFFLPGAAFVGWTPEAPLTFTSVTGVYAVFVPAGAPLVRYKELYPRTMAEAVTP